MTSQLFLRACLLPALALLFACASPYTPSPDRPFEPITEFTSTASVDLVNAAPEGEWYGIGGKMQANNVEWTDVAIEVADRELTKRGMSVGSGGDKTLALAITDVRYRVGWVKISTEIDMDVTTGGGYSTSYTSRNSSTMVAVPKRQVDGALMRIVVELLNDPQIAAYLTE